MKRFRQIFLMSITHPIQPPTYLSLLPFRPTNPTSSLFPGSSCKKSRPRRRRLLFSSPSMLALRIWLRADPSLFYVFDMWPSSDINRPPSIDLYVGSPLPTKSWRRTFSHFFFRLPSIPSPTISIIIIISSSYYFFCSVNQNHISIECKRTNWHLRILCGLRCPLKMTDFSGRPVCLSI